MSEKELAKAKNQTEATFIMSQDSLFYRGMLLGRYQTIGSWKKLNEIVPGIRAVTAADVQRVAQKYLVKSQPHRGHSQSFKAYSSHNGKVYTAWSNQVRNFFVLLVIVLVIGCYLTAAAAADQVLGQRYVLAQRFDLVIFPTNGTASGDGKFDHKSRRLI